MRRVLIGALVVSAVAASAMGITLTSITPVTGATSSDARAITSDGKYVVGNSGASGFLWDASNGTRTISGTVNATTAVGVAYRMVGGAQQLVVNGLGAASNSPSTYWISSDGGSSWGQTLRNTSIYRSVVLESNSIASSGLDDVVYGTYTSNQTQNSVHTAKITSAGLTTSSMFTLSPTAAMRSVSASGLAVGWRKDSTLSTGIRQNWTVQDPIGPASGMFFNGLAGTWAGEAFAISANGAKIGGMSVVSDSRQGNWPYIYTRSTGEIMEMRTFADVPNSGTNGVVYGLSANGQYAVGHNFRTTPRFEGQAGHESAVLWDVQANSILDLTNLAAAAGQLGSFTQLNRAFSVGIDANGNPVVAGRGTWNDGTTRGFVLTIPEPASVLFLVLGGVALLARRR